MSADPVRDLLRAKGDPFAEVLDRLETEYRRRHGGERCPACGELMAGEGEHELAGSRAG